jgi:hypothetical protein
VTGAIKEQIGKRKSPIPPTPTREVGVAGAKVAETEGRVLRVEVTTDMSDDDDHSDESSDRRELEKARMANTPDEDPRGQTTEVAEAETSDTDTDE